MIAATFHGASYSPPHYDFDTIEVFPTLEDVIDALLERYTANGQRHIESTYLDGSTKSVYWPTVEVGDRFVCYRIPEWTPVAEHSADELEGFRLDVHTAAHGGWFDYTVHLAEIGGGVLAAVEKAGL